MPPRQVQIMAVTTEAIQIPFRRCAMLNLSDIIVSLWLLPVVLFIVLPLAMLVVYAGNRLLRKISGTAESALEPVDVVGRQCTKETV
jgi:hypothetical protein